MLIYILNDITIREELNLIMPCNIHLLNNDIFEKGLFSALCTVETVDNMDVQDFNEIKNYVLNNNFKFEIKYDGSTDAEKIFEMGLSTGYTVITFKMAEIYNIESFSTMHHEFDVKIHNIIENKKYTVFSVLF